MSQQISPELPIRLRRVRDSGALLFMLVYLGFLAYIIWDGLYMKGADVDLIVHGHDNYGNICGRNNKPIKFSDKSGQNYTDKPYTKYTLVNSKFERYTGRMRFGELVYEKELVEDGDKTAGDRLKGHELLSRSPTGGTSSSEGPRRGLEQRRQMESLLIANGKSTFSKREALEANHSRELARQGAIKKPGSRDNFSSTLEVVNDRQDIGKTEAKALKSEASETVRAKRQASAPIQTGAPMRFDLVELAQKNRSLLNALRSDLMYQYPPMYGYSDTQPALINSNSLPGSVGHVTPNSIRLNKTDGSRGDSPPRGSIRMTSPSSLVVFEDQSSHRPARLRPLRVNESTDDSDHYDHVFVPPRSVMMSSNPQSNGHIGPNEISNQLLYLTECVPNCPSEHVELIFYRCMPNNWRLSLFPNAINVTRTFIDDILTDVSHCYRELVYTFSLSLVLSLALLILLRFLASLIIWSCIVALVLIFISMAGYSWFVFYTQIMDLEHVLPQDSVYAEKLASSDKWLIGSIFLTFMTFAIVGTVLFMRKRILLVTTLFKESGKAIADMPLLLLQPLLTFAVLLAITVVWIMGLICLQSMKMPVVDRATGFVLYRTETLYKIMKWYHVFSFLWVSHFAIACQHYVIGASVSKWYFSPNRYQLGSPIGTSISELILYYMGTVALGSLLLAIFKVIRVITRQIQFLVQRSCMSPPLNSNQAIGGGSQLGASPSSQSTSACGSLGYVWRLFIWFFDNIVMIINRDAYVEVAIHGHSFLGGARRAFLVLASNPLRLLAIKSVSNLLLVLAKICVVIGTVSMAYMLLDGKSQQLNYSWSPIVISAVFAYVVAHWFLSVYEMVIDALFICYCEDYEQKNIELNQSINGSNFRAQILNNGQIY